MFDLKKVTISTIVAVVLTATAAATAAVAATDTFEKYGEVEGWNVFVDNSKQACLIERADDAGNVVQMGLTRKDSGVAYVGVFTTAKTDIKRDAKSDVAIMLGDNLYVGQSTGMRGNITKGYTGGYILTDNPQMVEDIAKQYAMLVFPKTKYAFVVDLTGTYKAIAMAKKCNAEQ